MVKTLKYKRKRRKRVFQSPLFSVMLLLPFCFLFSPFLFPLSFFTFLSSPFFFPLSFFPFLPSPFFLPLSFFRFLPSPFSPLFSSPFLPPQLLLRQVQKLVLINFEKNQQKDLLDKVLGFIDPPPIPSSLSHFRIYILYIP